MRSVSADTGAAPVVRILMVLDKPFRSDLRVEREISALRGAGHDVTLLCAAGSGEPAESSWRGAAVRRLSESHGRLARWNHYAMATITGRSLAWESPMLALALECRAEVLHAHDLPIALSALRVARRIGALCVFDRHENWPGLLAGLRQGFPSGWRRELLWRSVNSPAVWRRHEATALRNADLVIAVSQDAANELPVEPRRLAIVSNYVDHEQLPTPRPPRAHPPPLRLCFVGVLNAMWALAEVLRALALVDRDQVELILVGDGDDRGSLERLRTELRLDSRVQILGWRSRDEALAMVQDSHLCLLPLRDNELTRTTIGNKMFEYMGLERPVLSSGVGAMARIVRKTQAGVVVEPWTPEKLAATLDTLARDPAQLTTLGLAGRSAVVAEYNWGRERERLLDAYARLTSDGRDSRAASSS